MHRLPRVLLDGVALASILAGAVLGVFPALIVLIVTLFYDSAGGVLILLGSLISVLPHPAGPAPGPSSLPVFQTLETGGPMVLIRSILATVLCAVALALLLAARRQRARGSWLAAALCCVLACVAGGTDVALALIPALLAIAVGLVMGRAAGV